MKVCFLGGTRYSQPLDATTEKKFRILSDLGKMFVIGFSNDGRFRVFTQHARFYLLPRLPMAVLRQILVFTFGPVLALWLIFRHRVRILVAQSPYEGFAAGLAKLVAGWFGCKAVLVVESHGDFEEGLFLQRRLLLPGLYRFLMRRAARFAFRHAGVLRAVSRSTRAQLERWAAGKPILQFPTWTDIEIFLAAGEGKATPQGRHDIVYAGVLIERKGVNFLLDAFAQVAGEFPDTRLSIIGRAENAGHARSLREQVDRLGLDRRVAFWDAIPQAELAQRIAKACVLVLPSLSEGLPRVVLEAMACGTPVIGTQVGGIPEMIKDGVTGFLVPAGDIAALAERLRWVLAHPEEAEVLGRRARASARSFFSGASYVEGYRHLIQMAEDLLKER